MSRYLLQATASGLCLADTFIDQHPILIDFTSGQFNYRMKKSGRRREMLAKAVGVKDRTNVLDCTAGLGRDTFLLASLGCRVTMIERSPVLALLLDDALRRASYHVDLAETVTRIELVSANTIDYLSSMDRVPEVIILDPMFPARNKSAQVKGDMQMMQRFLGTDDDVDVLFAAACATKCTRIVLKRPLHDKFELSVKPTNTLKGSSVRFDVFVRG